MPCVRRSLTAGIPDGYTAKASRGVEALDSQPSSSFMTSSACDFSRVLRIALVLPALLIGAPLASSPARADFKLCNATGNRVGVSVGYKDGENWVTEGWWNIPAASCETLLKGNLVARYYYVYALDYDRGGQWGGQAFMCTKPKEFTIRGIENCIARGFDRTGFFEIDTGEQPTWTVQLTEGGETDQTAIANPSSGTSADGRRQVPNTTASVAGALKP